MKLQKLNQPIAILALDGAHSEAWLRGFFGIKPLPMIGCYKGEKEQSFMIVFHQDVNQDKIRRRARLAGEYCGQESVLYSDEHRNTLLIDCKTGNSSRIGKLKEISQAKAKECENYTYNPANDTYWSTEV